MKKRMAARLQNWWRGFRYNYCWSDWVAYIDGWTPRLCLGVPIIGYLILFNDSITEQVEFVTLAGREWQDWGLDTVTRLRFLYYALFLLGISNFIYRIRKPYQFRFGTNLQDYTRNVLDLFTVGDYINIHETIRHEGNWTLDGKYYDSEWKGFLEAATNRGEGTDNVKRTGNWEDAKMRYGSLLRSMLREQFFRHDTRNRSALTTCIIMSTLGYILLAVPSLDLFLKVTAHTISE